MTAVAATWHLFPRRWSLPARWRNPVGIAGAAIVFFVILTTLFGHYIWTTDPNKPAWVRLEGPSWAHPFGTDDLGRDTLARIIHGAQVSLQVGGVATGIADAIDGEAFESYLPDMRAIVEYKTANIDEFLRRSAEALE